MSTLIVVGKIDAVRIIDKASGDFRPDHYPLKNSEMIFASIKIERVLYPSAEQLGFNKAASLGGADVAFDGNHLDVKYFRQKLLAPESRIFYLVKRNDGLYPDYYYPFYLYTNFFDPITKETEVNRLIAAFTAIK